MPREQPMNDVHRLVPELTGSSKERTVRRLSTGGLAAGVGWALAGALAFELQDHRSPKEWVLATVITGCVVLAAWLLLTKASRALALSQRRLNAVAESSEEMLWEADASGQITFANSLMQKYFGYGPRDLTGLSLAALVHPDEHAHLAALVSSGSGWKHERFRCLHRDGSQHWFEGSAIAHVGNNGRLLGYTGSCHRLAADPAEAQRLTDLSHRVRAVMLEDAVRIVFQPIVSLLDGRLKGAEALSRFDTPEQQPPDRWFADASEVGLAADLELHAVRRALSAARTLPSDIYVSVNVSPWTLAKPELLTALQDGPLPLSRIVIEVTEHVSVDDYGDFDVPVQRLRAAGVRLAVDDAGAGYSSFRHILRLAPEFIKLDRALVAGLDQDPALRALTAAVVMFALEMGATVIAEGVETIEEFRAAEVLGVDAVQGYLIGKPTGDWHAWTTEAFAQRVELKPAST